MPPPDQEATPETFPKAALALLDAALAHGGRIPAPQTAELLKATSATLEQLMVRLLPWAARFAVTPISNYPVGAIVAGDGPNPTLYFGANFEFPGGSLGFSIHAEQSALNHAWLANETNIARLAVTAAPCGHCRQFMRELPGADQLRIVIRGSAETSLRDLLPSPFGPDALGVTERLLAPHRRALTLATPSTDPVVLAALEAAGRSHAPYSQSPVGCALQLRSGRIESGRTAECAAYNPTLPAIASAISALVLREGTDALSRIERVVMVEKAGAASQRTASAAMAACVVPAATFDYFAAR